MKKSLLVLGLVSVGLAHAQQGNVGINTDSPRATFEIKMSKSNESTNTNQGLLIPNLKRSRVSSIAKPVDGTIIYVDTLDGTASGKVANITEKGFYYYNGANWVKLSGTTTATPGTPIAGPKGADGKTILNGTSNPTSSQGTEGDFYINTATNQIFGPKTASGWGTGTSIKGERGERGQNGLNGAPGTPGRNGTDGRGITTITASGNQATITLSDGSNQVITLPKGEKGDTGPRGPAGSSGSARAIPVSSSRNLEAGDNGNYLYVNGNNITLTATGLNDGFSCVIIQMGNSQVTVSGAQSARGSKTRTQYSAIGVVKVNDTFVVTGDAVK